MVITVKKDDIKIEYSLDPSHGDFASTIAILDEKSPCVGLRLYSILMWFLLIVISIPSDSSICRD